MSMRTFSLAALVFVAGCTDVSETESAVAAANLADRIECAIGKGSDFEPECALERADGGRVTLRHRDGGFRRLILKADGEIATADGADIIDVQQLDDGRSEVMIADDRYRLPATL